MVSACHTTGLYHQENFLGTDMSSYLPIRHGVPRGEDLHSGDNSGYMDHFLNIPEICPTGNYRTPRYYMGSYQTDACRMEALQQQRNHELRMGLQANRTSFYPNMNVPGMRFGDPGIESQTNCVQTHGRTGDNVSPCSKGGNVAAEGETPSFYPWMSIVGLYMFLMLLSLSLSIYLYLSLIFPFLPRAKSGRYLTRTH